MSGPLRFFAHLGGICCLALLVTVVVLLLGGADLGMKPVGRVGIVVSLLWMTAWWLRLLFDEFDDDREGT